MWTSQVSGSADIKDTPERFRASNTTLEFSVETGMEADFTICTV
jgi:hypothetical protein